MPTTLLAVDTATEICSVALARGEQVTGRAEAVGQRHSERVLPMVHDLLSERGLRLQDCDAVAFGAGPGAFTGLRIACAIAQGLAYGIGRPVVAVGNLAALALAASGAAPGVRRVLAAIDARMQEAYWAVYSIDGDRVREVSAPALAPAGELADICRSHAPDLVAGSALLAFPEAASRLSCALAPEARASASTIVRLAATILAEGGAVAADEARPVYVRDRVALTIDERRPVAGGGRR